MGSVPDGAEAFGGFGSDVPRKRSGRGLRRRIAELEAEVARLKDHAEDVESACASWRSEAGRLDAEVERRGRLIAEVRDSEVLPQITPWIEWNHRAFTPDGDVRWGEAGLSDEEKEHREAGKFRHGNTEPPS